MGILRPAYVRVNLEDGQTTYVLSPAPFLYRDGEMILPANIKTHEVQSYSALRTVLQNDFNIPASMVPATRYFRPNKSEITEGVLILYRTAPKGAGEPEWRTRARQALHDAVADASISMKIGDGRVDVNGIYCSSIESLRDELLTLAKEAGGGTGVSAESYQPDYDVLVEEALQRDSFLLHHSGLPKKQRIK